MWNVKRVCNKEATKKTLESSAEVELCISPTHRDSAGNVVLGPSRFGLSGSSMTKNLLSMGDRRSYCTSPDFLARTTIWYAGNLLNWLINSTIMLRSSQASPVPSQRQIFTLPVENPLKHTPFLVPTSSKTAPTITLLFTQEIPNHCPTIEIKFYPQTSLSPFLRELQLTSPLTDPLLFRELRTTNQSGYIGYEIATCGVTWFGGPNEWPAVVTKKHLSRPSTK